MIAVSNGIINGKESVICMVCHGTGIISHWSEFAFFDDRRCCPLCEAGRQVEKNIGEIIERAESDDYWDYKVR